VSGTINPVTDLSGTSICLTASCTSPAAQDWLLVTVTLDLGSLSVDQIGMSVPASPSISVVGLGHYSDPGVTPTGANPNLA